MRPIIDFLPKMLRTRLDIHDVREDDDGVVRYNKMTVGETETPAFRIEVVRRGDSHYNLLTRSHELVSVRGDYREILGRDVRPAYEVHMVTRAEEGEDNGLYSAVMHCLSWTAEGRQRIMAMEEGIPEAGEKKLSCVVPTVHSPEELAAMCKVRIRVLVIRQEELPTEHASLLVRNVGKKKYPVEVTVLYAEATDQYMALRPLEIG